MTLSQIGILLSLCSFSNAFVGPNMHQQVQPHRTLLFSKDSDRAHIERNLEDMMDNDWRVFRAKLVAQEKLQNVTTTTSSTKSRFLEASDEKLAKQSQLGDLFAGAISSIFNGNNANNLKNKESDAVSKRNKRAASKSSKEDIFIGDHIGGLDGGNAATDPFVSADELPLLWGNSKPNIRIDKHRWAHEIPHIEPGCVLLANEKLGGVFHQTVVLIIEHTKAGGSTGVVINRYVRGAIVTH